MRGELAGRLAGSHDAFPDASSPAKSVNFIVAHDGFTLADLVSYEQKHNEANLEDNQDGTDDNRSWNGGVEGPADDAAVVALRARQQRNFLATLLLSQGTPMLLGGDEIGRTQHGNNNAWCQDNEISWYDWDLDPVREELREFTRRLIALRHRHPVFRRNRFLIGGETMDSGLPDAWWFRPDGRKMTRRDWQSGQPVLGLFLNGREIPTPGPHGEEIEDDSFLLIFNATDEDQPVVLPWPRFGSQWMLELCTADPAAPAGSQRFGSRDKITLISRSVVVLKRSAAR
jgi:glycogen operon protein